MDLSCAPAKPCFRNPAASCSLHSDNLKTHQAVDVFLLAELAKENSRTHQSVVTLRKQGLQRKTAEPTSRWSHFKSRACKGKLLNPPVGGHISKAGLCRNEERDRQPTQTRGPGYEHFVREYPGTLCRSSCMASRSGQVPVLKVDAARRVIPPLARPRVESSRYPAVITPSPPASPQPLNSEDY